MLTDPETDKGYSIGLWRTQAERFAEVLAARPVRETCEVGIGV